VNQQILIYSNITAPRLTGGEMDIVDGLSPSTCAVASWL